MSPVAGKSWPNSSATVCDTWRRGVTSYADDADGTLLLTADPGTTTLYLPDEELALSTSTAPLPATTLSAVTR